MIAGVRVMGILNVTPDSFSDGGKWDTLDRAIAHGSDLIRDGADIVDIGGESTRPGAIRLDQGTEQARVIPVIRELSGNGADISIDTVNAETARLAIEAGATIINDVSGGLADPDMLACVAEAGVDVVLMHWRGFLEPGEKPSYADVVADVNTHLSRRIDAALAAGVDPKHIIIDPGLGFSKTAEHNWALLRAFERLTALGFPVLVGASRKRFITELIGEAAADARDLTLRDVATAAISVFTAQAGGWGVRVHDVAGTVVALQAWKQLAAIPEIAHA